MGEFRSQHNPLSPEEKGALKEQILYSIKAYRQRMNRFRVGGIAAALLMAIMFAYGYGVLFKSTFVHEAMLSEVKQTIPISEEVLLLMGDDRAVSLGAKQSSIHYNSSSIVLGDTTISPSSQPHARYHTVVVPYGRSLHMHLSDGTQVWLHAGSRLVYPRVL